MRYLMAQKSDEVRKLLSDSTDAIFGKSSPVILVMLCGSLAMLL